ncbi:glutathione transferase [Ranunculus cassubicifolius]
MGTNAAVELLPKEYGYVILVFVLYFFLNIWMGFRVGAARKKYNVPYPTLYALESENHEAMLFNCVQRGHQNTMEMMPMFLFALGVGGLPHPLIAAPIGLLYVIGRAVYFVGYSTGEPKNRLYGGSLSLVCLLGLIACSISLAVHVFK